MAVQAPFLAGSLALLMAGGAAPALAADQPLLINYGTRAPVLQGDNDHHQAIYVSLPAALTGQLYLRIFDADTGWKHDQLEGRGFRGDVRTRYSFFGGDGAYVARPADPLALTAAEMTAGTEIATRTIGAHAGLDTRWMTLTGFTPEQGQLVGDRRIFRLVVDALSGRDGNVYDVAVSTAPEGDIIAPDGLRLFSLSPTVRMPDRGLETELRFHLPADADGLVIGNFDAAAGQVNLTTRLRSFPLSASDQGVWATDRWSIPAAELRGAEAGLTLAGGSEYPNDITFYATTPDGRPVEIDLLPELWALNQRPEPMITTDDLGSCMSVRFDAFGSKEPDGDPMTYRWQFGDGESASGEAVTHLFATEGYYTGRLEIDTLVAQLGSGAQRSFRVLVKNPPEIKSEVRKLVPLGETVAFDGSASTGRAWKLTHRWDFGDGSSATGDVVPHDYTKPGTYRVTHSVTDDSGHRCNTASETFDVIINDAPIAASGDDRRIAIAEETVFDAAASTDSDGIITRYQWDLGDGSTAEGPVVRHAYATPGTYEVRLTLDDNAGATNSRDDDTLTVIVNDPPIAVAGADRRIAIDETSRFDGSPSSDPDGTLISYLWEFGDGATAAEATVEHEYAKSGTYTATPTITDDSTTKTAIVTDTLTVVVNEPPVPAAGDDRRIAIDETSVFDGTPSVDADGALIAYAWDFGDGATASGARVEHDYDKSGTYTATLTVTDDSTTRTAIVADTLTVIVNEPPLPAAGDDRNIAIAETSRFDAGASRDLDGSLIAYDWDFGDGATASGARVDHDYAKSGPYTVMLTVTDDSTTKTKAVSDTLTVFVNEPPIARAGDDRSVAIAEPIAFDAVASTDSDGKLIHYLWDFGDGVSGEGAAISHDYAKSGTYEVRLTIKDDSTTRTDTVSDVLSVRVNEPPVARAGDDQLVTASLVKFDASQSSDLDDSVAKYQWDFGDGGTGEGVAPSHVYAEPGTYEVRLTVTDASGTIRSSAEDTLSVVVNARPIADAGPDLVGAPGERLVFQGGRSVDPDGKVSVFEWDFRDGATATGDTVAHSFAEPGTYLVRLKIVDDTAQGEAVDFAETEVFVNAVPVAEAGPDLAAVPGVPVALSAASSFDQDGAIASYRWDFSDSAEPVFGAVVDRVFAEPGIYTAQLTVTDDSGAANSVATDELRIAVNHTPVAEAGANIDTEHLTVAFDAGASVDADGDPLAYRWEFGDGAGAIGPIVTHTYATGGTYPVVLTVDDGTGLANAESRDSLLVNINRAPAAVAGDDHRVCTGEAVVLDGSNSTDPEGGVLRYSWDFGDGTATTIVNPTKTYLSPGVFPVTLSVKDDSGFASNVHADRLAVTVDQGPIAAAGPDVTACALTEVSFDGTKSSDVDGVVNSYRWDFGDGSFGGGEKPSHIYDKPGDYRATLTVDGEQVGLCSPIATDEVRIKIVAGPVAVIDAPAALPITDAAIFDGSASSMTDGTLTGWHWDFGDGESASGAKVEHRYAKPGQYRVILTLSSDSAAPSCQQVEARHLITINAAPLADAGANRAAAIGEEVAFDASASQDIDGAITAYEWDFGDGTTATGITTRHRYAAAGTYQAKLVVRDNANLPNSSASAAIAVAVNAAPVPVIDGPMVACVGDEVSWQGGGSTDANGPLGQFAWSFGDGGGAGTATATHRYQRAGR